MAFGYLTATSTSVASAGSITFTPDSTLGALYVAVFAFQGVASGSAPWIQNNTGGLPHDVIGTFTGWKQACQQAPSGTGVGIEVWCAINGGSGPRIAQFLATQTCQVSLFAYTGAYAPTGSIFDGCVRATATAQVTGNTPAAPSINANTGELVVACGGDLMQSPGFGTPTGYTLRIDGHDSGFGSVEAAIADKVAAVTGATGAITFPGTAATTGTLGSTATLAIIPATATVASVGPVISFSYPVT